MNQDYYTSNNDQKPNSRSSSVVMSDADLEATKRRRLVESAPASSNNIMFRPTPMQSALVNIVFICRLIIKITNVFFI